MKSPLWPLLSISVVLATFYRLADCYDPRDPYGNVTVVFDIHKWTDDGYLARVTIQNYQLYRHVDKLGWQLGWTWAKDEVIWSISGAYATQNGNCSSFMDEIPHSCLKSPVIRDLPDSSKENRSGDRCRGGVLSAWAVDPSESFSSFDIRVGRLEQNTRGYPPLNLTLVAPGPGYTCSPLIDTDPTISSDIGGRREVQVLRTWKSACSYSSILAKQTPVCCVSLSSFYNPKVTGCPSCSCGCKEADQKADSCISKGNHLSQSDALGNPDILRCSDHNCPVGIHWHVKNNYVDYWRVKLTVSNFNYKRNYSHWNLLVQHPGFSQNTIVYSFNSSLLPTAGLEDSVALFWGIDNYNSELQQAEKDRLGSVATDIILQKNRDAFTLKDGWAFPRKIYFNGEDCQMPLPDQFPTLPNDSSGLKASAGFCILVIASVVALLFGKV
ncbi:hypothetical protein MLD38_023415 [Melastoma candidum]|uniref:Uncharacterized protein n=1 Tax=Melastoma candidum TaxID=119954 RepID=A0ACB9QMF9_9MYRT|nr:hypothetical protein MLD38_023415 [Melastoma candidum]